MTRDKKATTNHKRIQRNGQQMTIQRKENVIPTRKHNNTTINQYNDTKMNNKKPNQMHHTLQQTQLALVNV